ncbi:MAG: hypothetical protein OXQ94_01010 [Gemmatimonadota bacterium]|nr:hypothetical protein [Gemmatimonadota bacterium]
MAIHDAYARFTPYELLLPDGEFPERHFPGIGAEARQRGIDTDNPAAFVMLGAVQGALAELREEGAGPGTEHDHGGVLFFAYHMWRTDGEVVLARQETLRGLLAGGAGVAGAGGESLWVEDLKDRAGYFQLPQHMVWIEEARSGPPESMDGFFWIGDGTGVLHLALVAGMRGDRPGYAVVPVPPQPLDALPGWAAGPAREEGRDFETSLPGAELDGLLGIRTPAETFKLAALLFARMAGGRPGLCPPPESASPGQPRPSALPFATL